MENVVADSLSRRDEEKGQCMSLPQVQATWLQQLISTLVNSPMYAEIKEKIDNGGSSKYKLVDGLLFYKRKILIDHHNSSLLKTLINEFHSTPLGGHSGIKGTVKRIKAVFYWKRMKRYVEQYVKECDVC